LKEQNINYFNAVKEGNAMIRELIIEKAEKGYLGLVSLEDRINSLPQYSKDHEELTNMIEKLDDINTYNHKVAELNHQDHSDNLNILNQVNAKIIEVSNTLEVIKNDINYNIKNGSNFIISTLEKLFSEPLGKVFNLNFKIDALPNSGFLNNLISTSTTRINETILTYLSEVNNNFTESINKSLTSIINDFHDKFSSVLLLKF
jgi:hypothetical protein